MYKDGLYRPDEALTPEGRPLDSEDVEQTLLRWGRLEPDVCRFAVAENTWLLREGRFWYRVGREDGDPWFFEMVAANFARASHQRHSWGFSTEMYRTSKGQSGFILTVKVYDNQGHILEQRWGSDLDFNRLLVQSYVAALEGIAPRLQPPPPEDQVATTDFSFDLRPLGSAEIAQIIADQATPEDVYPTRRERLWARLKRVVSLPR